MSHRLGERGLAEQLQVLSGEKQEEIEKVLQQAVSAAEVKQEGGDVAATERLDDKGKVAPLDLEAARQKIEMLKSDDAAVEEAKRNAAVTYPAKVYGSDQGHAVIG